MPANQKRQRQSTDELLRYHPKPASRATVRRHYASWRERNGIPPRCDIKDCGFHAESLLWLGQPLPLILDHVNGNNLDNSPKNLRYLCPNCDSQLTTRGGHNRGRVLQALEGGYILGSKNGNRHYHLIAEGAHYKLTGHAPTIAICRPASTP